VTYKLVLKEVVVDFDPRGGHVLKFEANGAKQWLLLEVQRGARWTAGMLGLSQRVPGIPEKTRVLYNGKVIEASRMAQHEKLASLMMEALQTDPDDCPRLLCDLVELELDNAAE